MSIFKWFIVLMLAALLHTCGLTTALYNNVFPPKYSLTSTAQFSRDGQTHSQSIVTACKIADQRGSLLINFAITVTGERHWMRFPDGSILVLGRFNFCIWIEKPPEPTTRLTLAEYSPRREYVGILPIHDSRSYYFDNANDPARLRLYSTTELMAGHSDLVRVNPIDLAVGGARPTHTIDAAFPWLSRVPPVAHDHARLRRASKRSDAARTLHRPARNAHTAGGWIALCRWVA